MRMMINQYLRIVCTNINVWVALILTYAASLTLMCDDILLLKYDDALIIEYDNVLLLTYDNVLLYYIPILIAHTNPDCQICFRSIKWKFIDQRCNIPYIPSFRLGKTGNFWLSNRLLYKPIAVKGSV